jgi:cellulose synthase/poly-beta-1,6-N-acetylglucosamine synthase-like glycosyltransferase
MACRGDEPHLEENIEAILNQSYPKFRIIIVTDTKDDPAYSVANMVLKRHSTKDAHLFTADAYPRASGKVAALLTGLERDGWASQAYAFVDSDALTTSSWLRDMVDPLRDPSVGATTGFRWYIPERGGFWSQVESAWNASGTNVMFNEEYNFPWGGAMAILKDTMNTIHLRTSWETAVSDDLSLNGALREHNYRVYFIPQCTVLTYSRATARSFLAWAIRQTALTRVFNRRLWNYGLTAYSLFTVISALGVATLIAGITLSTTWLLPAALLIASPMLGVFRSNQRIGTFERALPEFASYLEKNHWAHSIASLIVPWVMTYCILKSARTNEIEWRGRKYRLTGQRQFAST